MTGPNSDKNASFDALLRPHLDRLYRFAYRLCGSKAEAEDLFQDVLVKVFSRLDDLIEVREPGSWLCRVMYNYFIDNQRRFARQRLVSVNESQLPEKSLEALPGTIAPGPAAAAERRDDIMQLEQALEQLSDEHRMVVMLHDCEGYKLQEIQDITGDPIGTLKSRLHRARARLRELLANDGTISVDQACND